MFSFYLQQIKEISFCREVSTKNHRLVLATLGGRLQELGFDGFDTVNISHLIPCVNLENLLIDCRIAVTETEGLIRPDVFLPNLKKLQVESCLNSLSRRLMETPRPSLKQLSLTCAHFGIQAASGIQWEDVPDLWPNIQELSFRSSQGLTMDTLCDIIPRFNDLQKLKFPFKMFRQPSEEEGQSAT